MTTDSDFNNEVYGENFDCTKLGWEVVIDESSGIECKDF